MHNVKVVTAYVPLDVKHLSREQYLAYGERLRKVIGDDLIFFEDWQLDNCWLYQFLDELRWLNLPPATKVPEDRYETPAHMVRSNIVQHQRTSWLRFAADYRLDADILVWLDLAILKQGAFTGNPVVEQHITDFVRTVKEHGSLDMIHFPGIWGKGDISDTGDNWRFVGSTHIIPRKHLHAVDQYYKHECRKFIMRTGTVPLDLPIWAAVEKTSGLPFVQYPANHDASQLTNYPAMREAV